MFEHQANINDGELFDAKDFAADRELAATDRRSKKEIRFD